MLQPTTYESSMIEPPTWDSASLSDPLFAMENNVCASGIKMGFVAEKWCW